MAFDGERVCFKVKDHRKHGAARYGSILLDAHEFIRRFLLHVLPDGYYVGNREAHPILCDPASPQSGSVNFLGGSMTARSDMGAPRAWARIAGLLWLVTIGLGLFAEAFVRARLITNDAATTLGNILANETSYRLGEAALYVGTAAYLALTAIMYRLLAPAGRTVSLMAAFFSVAGCVIWMLALVNDASPLVFFANGQPPSAPGAEAQQALAFGLLKLHSELLLLGMLCFGVHCLLMGCLVVRATFLPALLGLILAVGGACYVAAGLLHVLSPALSAQFGRLLFLPGEAGEALMGLWLALVAVNAAKWKAMAE